MTTAHRGATSGRKLLTLVILTFLGAAGASASATTVRFQTAVGNFTVDLFDNAAPSTVANFLNYVTDGDYDGTIVHRSISDFVIQGGGFDASGTAISSDGPVGVSEVGISNLRGTIAMAFSGDATQATNQWFINVVDNPFLDTQSGGFAVFGQVRSGGMPVVDAINALPVISAGTPFDNLPTLDGVNPLDPLDPSNLVVITSVRVIPEPASIAMLGPLVLSVVARRRRR